MKIALDPFMIRSTPLLELPGVVADHGYRYIELSPREDFMWFFTHPRADKRLIAKFNSALKAADVEIAAVLPLYKWADTDEIERTAAVRYWKRAIEITVDLGCQVMNSEFNGDPTDARRSEGQWWKSMEELLPIFEREGVELRLEPHPNDFIEDGKAAIDLVRAVNSDLVSFLYCAPHTFHQGGDIRGVLDYAGPLTKQVHVADSFDHTASSGLRYIINNNPASGNARIHQHLDIGQGEVNWDEFFSALNDNGFDGIMTACVFAWEERAEESNRYMLETINKYVTNWNR